MNLIAFLKDKFLPKKDVIEPPVYVPKGEKVGERSYPLPSLELYGQLHVPIQSYLHHKNVGGEDRECYEVVVHYYDSTRHKILVHNGGLTSGGYDEMVEIPILYAVSLYQRIQTKTGHDPKLMTTTVITLWTKNDKQSFWDFSYFRRTTQDDLDNAIQQACSFGDQQN